MRRSVPVIVGVLLALALTALGESRAATLVHFEDGRVLKVAEVVEDGAMLSLRLEGGGGLMLPAWRVSRWEPAPAEPKPPAVVPAAVAAGHAAWRQAAGSYAESIADAAVAHQVDPALLTAMAQVESAFDHRAVSPKGASGLLQLMPATADRFGVQDVFDAGQNIEGGARYLRWLLDRYDGRTDLALAGYNAGEAAVDRYNGIPPYSETRDYVNKVLAGLDSLRDRAARAIGAPALGHAARLGNASASH